MPTCIRFTMFHPGGPPLTVAAPEESFKDSVGDVNVPSKEGMFIVKDVFECDSDEIFFITKAAMDRAEERFEREANMAIMYHFIVAQRFQMMAEGGTIAQTVRSPLSADELTYVHEALAAHPDYKNYRFMSLDENGNVVTYP